MIMCVGVLCHLCIYHVNLVIDIIPDLQIR